MPQLVGGAGAPARSQASLSRPSSPALCAPYHCCNPCQVTTLTDGSERRQLFSGRKKDGGRFLPGCVSSRLAKRGELQNCSEEPEETSLRHGAQVKCPRSGHLKGPTTFQETQIPKHLCSVIILMKLSTQERAGLLVKRDSLTPPRKGLVNQGSVEDDEVGAVLLL